MLYSVRPTMDHRLSQETSLQQLQSIVRTTKPQMWALPGYESSTIGLFGRPMLGVDCDEVYPNLFIGDVNCALNKAYLRHLGITHVLNVAEGNSVGMVNTNGQYYADVGIHYMGIPLIDEPWCIITPYIQSTAEYIDDCITNGGKVLIHCVKGYSRSPAIAITYLATKVQMTVPMALKHCCSRRAIRPNDGFLHQLSVLNNVVQLA